MKHSLALLLCLLIELPSAAAVIAPQVRVGLAPALAPSLAAPSLSAPTLQAPLAAPTLSLNGTIALAPAPALAAAPALAVPFAAHPLLAAVPAAPGPVAAAARGAAEAARQVLAHAGFAAPSKDAKSDDAPVPAASSSKKKLSTDYPRMFALARETMKRSDARKFLREIFKEELTLTEDQLKEYGLTESVREMSESQFMLLLQHNQDLWPEIEKFLKAAKREDKADPDEADREFENEWRAKFRVLLEDADVLATFKKFNDPLTPMRLDTADGRPGYRNAEVHANHQRIVDGKTVPAGDLKKVMIDFIAGAETELMFNVFDFDLMDVADAMIARAKDGVIITGGIDKSVVETRPEVKAVFDKLNKAKGITIRAVDSVGLNHQKVMIRDFNDDKKAKALFSSGNFTQSCVGPEGDLKDLPADKRPKDSIPNANHVLVLDSFALAQVAANSLTKTLVYGLRGAEYPLDGAYRILGDDGQWIVISFSPRGGLGDINRDMTRRLIMTTTGPLRLMQFAFSSTAVRDAIIERARIEGKDFDLKTVGDTPFAVRPWSIFLDLAGWALKEDGEKKEYVKAAANALREVLGAKKYEEIRANLRVGPRAYKNHFYKDGEAPAIQYGAKIHHKVVISGGFAVLGTSFNFSEAANSNQEQFLVTSDKALVAAMTTVFDGLFALATVGIVDEIIRRNEMYARNEAEEGDGDEKQYEHVDKEARRSRK